MAKSPANKSSGSPVDADVIRELAALLDETGLAEIEVGQGDWKVRVAKDRGASMIAAAPAIANASPAAPSPAPTSAASLTDHPGAIIAPVVGTVYVAPDPESEPFVRVGDQVTEGQTLVMIEAMKVFNPIPAPKAGKVAQILVSNGDPVEYGEVIVILE